MSNFNVARRSMTAVALPLVAVMLAACGTAASGDSGGSGRGSSGGELSVGVIEPASGASVSVPFAVKLTSSVPLGAENTGLHHVHLYFDDNENDYLIVRDTTVMVSDAPPGAHTMHLSLRNANHSAAGAEFEVPLTITSGSGPAPGSEPGAY